MNTLAVGDVVRARTARGLWVIVDIRLVRGEAECRRPYGGTTRVFDTADLTPVRDDKELPR